MRIQTVEPWKRILVLAVGAFFGAVAFVAMREKWSVWSVLILGGISLGLAVIALIGRRKPIDAVVDAAGDVVFQRVIDAIF